jgi:hypothetical protein
MTGITGWLLQNWLMVLVLGFIVFFGWNVWPRLRANARRWVAGGLGLVFLAIILAQMAGGARFDPARLARAILMGLAGLFLILTAYFPRYQNSLLEYAGWSMLISAASVSLLFRGSSLLVQGLVFVGAAAIAGLLQAASGSPASEWRDPPRNRWRS